MTIFPSIWIYFSVSGLHKWISGFSQISEEWCQKLTKPQKDLQSLTEFGCLRLMIASLFFLFSVYDGLPSFNINVRPLCVKWSSRNWHLLEKISIQTLFNALKRFAKSSKCWCVLEKTIISSMIILYLSLFGTFSNIIYIIRRKYSFNILKNRNLLECIEALTIAITWLC